MAGSLGDAFIEVHADTDKLGPEIEAGTRKAADEAEARNDFEGFVKAADKAGSRAGDQFGKSFIRDAAGRLHDENGRFVNEGKTLGAKVGDEMGDSLGDHLEKKTKSRVSRLGNLLAPAWIRTVGAWIAALSPAIVQLVGTLAPSVGILAALVPAAIGGAAAIGVLHLAFGGLSKTIAEATTNVGQFNQDLSKLGPATQRFVKGIVALQPQLKEFRKNIQDAFFAGFGRQDLFSNITNALNKLYPILNAISYVLGNQLGKAVDTLLSSKSVAKLTDIFTSFDRTLFHLGPILTNIINTLLTVGQVASPLLESLVAGFERVTKRFDTFIQTSARNGNLKKFFDEALIALNQLGKLAGSVLRIVGDLLDAGAKAGGGNTIIAFFGQLADIFDQLNASGALTAFFKVFNQIFGSLSTIIKPLLPLVSQLISLLGGELGKILVALTPPLAEITKAIADALIPVLPSLQRALDALTPVLVLFAQAFADVIKQISPDVAKVLVQLFEALATTLIDLAPSIKALLPALGQLAILLVNLLTTQTIAALQILVTLIPPLAKGINAVLVPALNALTGVLKPLNQLFSDFVIPFVSQFASQASAEFDKLGDIADKVGGFFDRVGKDIGDFFTKTIPKWFDKLKSFFSDLPGNMEKLIKTAVRHIFDNFLGAVGVGIGLVYVAFTKLPGKILDALTGLGHTLFDYLLTQWGEAVDSVFAFLTQVDTNIRQLPHRILNALSSLGSTIKKAFKDAFENALIQVNETFNKIVKYVHDLPGRVLAFAGKLLDSGKKLVSQFLEGLAHPGKIVNSISDTVFGFLKDKINYVITKLNQGIDKVGHFIPGGIPHIPKLARGAFLKHPTLALIAESKPEVVLPTDDPRRASQLLRESGLDRAIGMGGGPNVTVYVKIGEQDLTDIVDTRVEYANDRTANELDFGVRNP